MDISLYLPNARHPDPLQLGFHKPHDSPVGISEIAIVGAGNNHTSTKTELTATVQGAQPAGPMDVPRLAEFLGLPLYIAPPLPGKAPYPEA